MREAGLISVELGDDAKADEYFSKLHALVPDYPMAIEPLIQVNQALKHDAKVEILIAQFQQLYAAGKVPEPYFVRERIRLDDGREIAITQFFDYHQPRYYAWAAELFDAKHNLVRRLTVNYDPDVTAHDAQGPQAGQRGAVPRRRQCHDQRPRHAARRLPAVPRAAGLRKMRTVLMEIFANALKPIDSAPVPQSAQ